MEHSLRGYLERQPTEELDRVLQECLSGDTCKEYAHVIPLILEVLAGREQKETTSIPRDILQKLMDQRSKGEEC